MVTNEREGGELGHKCKGQNAVWGMTEARGAAVPIPGNRALVRGSPAEAASVAGTVV